MVLLHLRREAPDHELTGEATAWSVRAALQQPSQAQSIKFLTATGCERLLRRRRQRQERCFCRICQHAHEVCSSLKSQILAELLTSYRNRPGYTDELPDYTKVKDAKGKTILCFSCGKSSSGTRMIIPCDFCGEHWHLDCLDPPRTNAPARNQDGQKVHDWMCPLHADHELRNVDTSLLNPRNVARKVHIRKPRNAKVVDTSLTRGFRNNGVVDVVIDDESDDSESEFYDDEAANQGVVSRLPASGIKLDFIDKVKR